MTTEFATVATVPTNDASSLENSNVTTEASGVIPVSNVQDSASQAALIANINSTAAAITQLAQKDYTWDSHSFPNTTSTASIQRERPDNVKAVWADPVQCPYGIPEEVCGSRVGNTTPQTNFNVLGEHQDFFRWSVHFPGFESYSVGDFVVLNSSDSNYSYYVAKILALWRCNSSRRNYASVLRFENAYTVLPDGDPRELLLALNRDPEKVELRLLKKLVRVLDLSGQQLPPQINLNDFDFYTYRFINTDGKSTSTVVPENLIIPKKIPDLSDKAKISRRRRESGPRKRKTEDGNSLSPSSEEMKGKKRGTKKLSNNEIVTATVAEAMLPIPADASSITGGTGGTPYTHPSVLDIVQYISQCEENPEEVAAVLGDLPFNKLKGTKKFLASILKVLDQMNIPSDQ